MKRIISIILALALALMSLFCFVACDEDSSSKDKEKEEAEENEEKEEASGTKYTGFVNGDDTEIIIDGDKATVKLVKEYTREEATTRQESTLYGTVTTADDGNTLITFSNGKVKYTVTGAGREANLEVMNSTVERFVQNETDKALMFEMLTGEEVSFTIENEEFWELNIVFKEIKVKLNSDKTFKWIY